MDKKQLQQLIIILPVILVLGIFAYYKYLLFPLNNKINVLKTDLEGIKKEYDESKGRAERLPKLEQEISVLNQEIVEMQKKLPPNKDVPGLIRLLSKRMDHYNIVWKSLSPGTQNSRDYYIEHSYSIPFKASYHDLAKFLSEIGQMERIFATRVRSLTPSADSLGNFLVSGELTFLIYTSK